MSQEANATTSRRWASKALRIVSILIGLMSFVTAIRLAFAPADAAAGLGMPVLDGVAASTQLGDIGALFLAVAVLVGLAQRPGQARLLMGPAVLMGCAAVMRTLVFLAGHAPFTPQFIVPEVTMAGLLFAAARARKDEVGLARRDLDGRQLG